MLFGNFQIYVSFSPVTIFKMEKRKEKQNTCPFMANLVKVSDLIFGQDDSIMRLDLNQDVAFLFFALNRTYATSAPFFQKPRRS